MDAQDALLSVDRDEFLSYLQMTCSMGIHCRLPAVVKSFNREKNIVRVQPAIKISNFDGTFQSLPVFEVGVHRYGGGGFYISSALTEGDTGDLVFYDKDISTFLKTLKECEPDSFRFHSFEDCEFFPINRAVEEKGANGLFLSKDDGTIFINLLNDKVLIKNSSTSLEVNSSEVKINPNLNVAEKAEIGGDLTAGGNISAGGVLSGSSIVAGSISSSAGGGCSVTGTLEADVLKARNGITSIGFLSRVRVENGIVVDGSQY